MSTTQNKGPVIIITGTPGTGKSTYAQLLAQESPIPLRHINVGERVKENELYEDFDEDWQSYTVDEDRVSRRNSIDTHFFFSPDPESQVNR